MAASSSSGSSFTSSSLGRPPTYSRSYVSPVDSTWTQTSEISTISATSTSESVAPAASLRPLDLGPPGYTATMYDELFRHAPRLLGLPPLRLRYKSSLTVSVFFSALSLI